MAEAMLETIYIYHILHIQTAHFLPEMDYFIMQQDHLKHICCNEVGIRVVLEDSPH